MKVVASLGGGLSLVATALFVAPEASAQSVESFYKGKTLAISISSGEGGTNDAYARLIAMYIGRYIPGNPQVVPRNMPGAGGLKAANYLYEVAPKDGTAYGVLQRSTIIQPLVDIQSATYDPSKFNWIGSTAKEVSVGVVWTAGSDIRTMDDAMKRELVVGSSGVGNDTGAFPLVLNHFLGTKFKPIHGYKSGSEITLAFERGEVQGRVGWSVGSLLSGSTADWLPSKRVTVLVQLGLFKHKNLPADVPLALDLAQSAEDRRVMELIFSAVTIGWPSFMGPNVPKERVAMVRSAYERALRDPDLLATAKKQKLEIDPLTAGDIEAVIAQMYGTPQPLIDRARTIMKYTGVE